MALQYIGARYVPRFTGTYDNTQVYEALDVVDNGLGSSYIAKIPTPAGTPLTNTTYWALYGASSGAIVNLQNQIDVLNSDVSTLNTNVSANTTRITNQSIALTNEANTRNNADQTLTNNLNSEIATRGTADANLQSQIDELVAPSGVSPNPAEVENARITYNGTTITTLGNAIRLQAEDNNKKFGELALINVDELSDKNTGYFEVKPGVLGWSQGSISVGNGSIDEIETTRIRTTALIDLYLFDRVVVTPASGYSYNYYYYGEDREYISGQANVSVEHSWKKKDVMPLGRRYLALVLRTTGGSDAIVPTDASNITIVGYVVRKPEKVRIMSYNVGRFNYGVAPSGLAPATASTMIDNFKNFLGKYQPDILCMNEFTKTMIQGALDDSNEIIFDDFFKDQYGRNVVYGNSIRSERLLRSPTNYNLISQDPPYNEFPVLQVDTIINGRPFTIICVHFVSAVDPGGSYATVEDARLAEMTALLSRTTSMENVIICGDFNSSSSGEKETFNTMAESAGFKAVNGGYFSFVPTWPYTGAYNCDDNIFIKGNIKVLSREVLSDEVENLPSDHIPIMTDILVY